ncbi:uncharacterized protein LOC120350448 [Nilaparvata lugens]|uniref:uncharacterized protein LOC120350448 n=1 Tax=Nilaparvata lugens TaxID=108931 RepID=UPI00193CFA2C|nr:uncharacterized protein LOC120350448 [Nilaparvata lugens]
MDSDPARSDRRGAMYYFTPRGIFLFIILMIGRGHANLPCNESHCFLKTGLVFMKEDDILITGDKWTVVVNIHVQEYHSVISSARDAIQMLEKEVEKEVTTEDMLMYVRSSEINRIRRIVDLLSSEIASFELMLPKDSTELIDRRRKKRGLINVGGDLLKVLFGTLSDDDLVRINHKISQLGDQSQTITHLVEDQVTVVKTIDQEVCNHGIILNETLDLLDVILQQGSQMNRTIRSELEIIEQALGQTHSVNSLMRELEITLLQVQKELLELRQSLEDTTAGKLSSLLLPPQNLSVILQQVVNKLPTGLSLLTTTDIDQIYEYYHIITVHAASTSNTIRLFLEIPLKSPNRYFTLYSVKPLPFLDTESNQFFVIKVKEDFLAVSHDGQRHVPMTHSDVGKCSGELYTLCPPNLPVLLNSNSCVFQLFVGNEQMVQKFCEKYLVSEHFEPVLYRIPETNDWLYSVSKPIRIVRECSLNEPHTKSEILVGVGIMNNVQNCFVHSEKFSLLPSTTGVSKVTVNRTNIIFSPVILDIFDLGERSLIHELFIKENHSDLHRERLYVLRQRLAMPAPGISINQLIHEARKVESHGRKLQAELHSEESSSVAKSVAVAFAVTATCIIVFCVVTGVTRRSFYNYLLARGRRADSPDDGLPLSEVTLPTPTTTEAPVPEVAIRFAKPGKVAG